MRVCSIEGCGKKHKARGLCKKHFDAQPARVAVKNARSVIYISQRCKVDPEFKARHSAFANASTIARYQVDPDFRARRSINSRASAARRRQADPFLCFKKNVRGLISGAFKRSGFSKNSKAAQILGADFDFAFEYVGWFRGCEIHHIVPVETAITEEDVIRLCHHTNLIALTVKEHKALHAGRFELIPRRT